MIKTLTQGSFVKYKIKSFTVEGQIIFAQK